MIWIDQKINQVLGEGKAELQVNQHESAPKVRYASILVGIELMRTRHRDAYWCQRMQNLGGSFMMSQYFRQALVSLRRLVKSASPQRYATTPPIGTEYPL